jgi:hypothetical protein
MRDPQAVSSGRAHKLNGDHISGVIGGFLGVEQDVLAASTVEFTDILDGEI